MTPNEKINNLTSTLGMSGKRAAEVIGMPYESYRKRKCKTRNEVFSEENYLTLLKFTKSWKNYN
jgi:uncharacterized protein (DUF2384 family)